MPAPPWTIMHALRFSLVTAAFAAVAWGPTWTSAAAAQDIEMLGRHHGTRPPEAYFEQIARDPASYRFELEGRERLLHIQRLRGARFPDLVLQYGVTAHSLGPRDMPMGGTFRFPLVLGLFSDSPPQAPFDEDRVQREYFDGPNSYHQTLTELYAEMSLGRVQLQGTTLPWVRADLTRAQAARGASGLVPHSEAGVGAFIEQIVLALDAQGIDWSRFDNSGDGFVDVLSVMHPGSGAECDGGPQRIWSHRWTLRSVTQGRLDPGIRTSTPRPDGSGYIYVNDYTIQPLLTCDGSSINEIGVFAHELGHGFGLPDLYGTHGGNHAGVGRWDLMGTGGWGCRGADAARPCHMGAWSKAALGWVDVIDVEPDRDHGTVTLPPVQTSGEVLRIRAEDGSGEFLLLENRQRIGSDTDLWEPGLLIWHVDPGLVEQRWSSNAVNFDATHMGVWLRQADGRDGLAGPGPTQGDPGHPFPGCIKDDYWHYFDESRPCVRSNRSFHAATEPPARGHGGGAFGATITGIELVGAPPHDVRFELSTRLTRIALEVHLKGSRPRPEGGATFLVDGEPFASHPAELLAVPFDRRTIEAPPGRPLGEGVRVGFERWDDAHERVREIEVPVADTVLRAFYGGEEVQVRWAPTSSEGTVSPGRLRTEPASPDLWFPRGAEVVLEADALMGFSFREWTGTLAEGPNPVTVRLDEPLLAEASFDYHYGFAEGPAELQLTAARRHDIQLVVEHGTAPFQWSVEEGELPFGMTLAPGVITGHPLEMGEFVVRVRVRDAIGLQADRTLTLSVGPPPLGMDRLTGPFLGTGLEPTPRQRLFLDRLGNENGTYDVGDLRAYLRAVPDVPAVTPSAAPSEAPVMSVGLHFPPEGGR